MSTPIMGMALSVAVGRRNGSAGYVVLGGLVVVAIGAVFSLAVPQDTSLLGNSQIASRTSPGLVDLVAAVATGFAGAVALSRRDVAAYSAEVRRAAEEWLVATPGATVTGVDFTSPTDVHVYVRQPGEPPPSSRLLQSLHGVVPDGITVHLDDSVGSDTTIGTVGPG